jgi:maltooligosyltrehalose trehalohydrolase
VKLTVWAPLAKSVELVTAAGRSALQPVDAARDSGESGYWHAEVDEAVLRGGYRYSIDGADPAPDPRSRWQPEGVHGASHVVDPSTFPQARAPADDTNSLRDAVIYEMHVGTFTPEGTYAAAQAKIPHWVDLGITHVELMPLATFPGKRGWGYDGVDLYAPHPAYGTPRELASFVQACHAAGLRVLLDVVYNHLGPDGNYLGRYGPYFTDCYRTAWGAAINYDGPQSDAVRRFIIDNALMWLRDYGFDGLRLDAVHAIVSFEAVHVLEELANAVRALGAEQGRRLVLIAESDLNDPRLVRPTSAGGYGLDAHWEDDFHHAIHRFFTGERDGYYADFHGLADVARALREGYVYQGQYSPHRERRHGRPPLGIGAHQLVVCAQNHDQIGNRAQGERLSMLLPMPQLKAVAALTLLSPFVPLLFQGEEWGARTPFLYFTDHENVELGEAVAAGRSKEFSAFRWQGAVPNPQELETFERSKLDWAESLDAQHAELYDWHRQVIRLRRTNVARNVPQNVPRNVSQNVRQNVSQAAPENAPPRVDPGGAPPPQADVTFDAEAGWLTMAHGDLLAVFNFAERPQSVPLPWSVGAQGAGGRDGAGAAEAQPGGGVPGGSVAGGGVPGRGHWRLVLDSHAAAHEPSSILPAHATRVYERSQ